MNTVILKWNPSFSSYTMRSFLNDMDDINALYSHFNWSVWDHDKISEGDEIFWLKVGYGQTGIVGHGTVISAPYEGEDWSGKGRKMYYVDFAPDVMLCADAFELLDSGTLAEAIPDFDWYGGHSGLVLSETQAQALRTLWKNFMTKNAEALKRSNDDNYAIRQTQHGTLYADSETEITVFISDSHVSLTSESEHRYAEISSYDVDDMMKAYGATSLRMLHDEFVRRYSHAHAINALSQDLTKLGISFHTSFSDTKD